MCQILKCLCVLGSVNLYTFLINTEHWLIIIPTFQMRLETNTIDRSPSCQKVPKELLEHREPAIAVHQDTIVIDKQFVVRKGTPDIFMDFRPDVLIARLIHVESVVCDTLLNIYI